MNKMSGLIILVCGVLSLGFLTSCSKGEEDDGIQLASGLPEEPEEDIPTGTSEKPSDSKFYVYAKISQNAEIYTHKKITDASEAADPKWEKKCEIDLDATSAADRNLNCLVEVHEADLYFLGVSLEFNVPKSYKCHNLALRPYFFERYNIGTGPTTFTENRDADGIPISVTGTDVALATDGTARCAYDYTLSKGPNCCLGDYVKTINTAGSGATTERGSWGGDIKSCLSGPGASGLLDFTEEGIPVTKVINFDQSSSAADSTLRNQTLSLGAPNDGSRFFGTNLFLANYLTDGATVPTCMDRTTSIASQYYYFSCRDNSNDVYAEIRVEIRDWNQKTELAKKSDAADPGDPDSSGAETDFPDHDWDDFDDWADAGNIYPGLGL